MKLLLITGRLAYSQVVRVAENVSRELGVDVDVLELPLPVAAMINSSYLQRLLPRYKDRLAGVDIVVVPGYAEGDMSEVSRVVGIPVLKGPRYINDLPLMVKAILRGVEFSPVQPADEVLRDHFERLEAEVLSHVKARARERARLLVGAIPVSSDYPLVVLEAYVSKVEDLEQYAEAARYADIVALGFPQEFNVMDVARAVEKARELFGKPIGVDTGDLELLRGVIESVDLVNGVSVEMIHEFAEKCGVFKEKPVVVVAGTGTPTERVRLLKKGVQYLKEQGFANVIVDPVLMPPLQGLAGSLEAYAMIKREMPDVPVLMGVGNVTELVDADSVGLNALLASIGVELGVEMYLTTEASVKTRGSTRELRKALDMAVLARELGRPPKDLSVNLLVLKSKKRQVLTPPQAETVVYALEKPSIKPDPKGYFRIFADYSRGDIVVQHYVHGSPRPSIEIRGRDPYAILAEVLKRGLASSLEHYFYLGYELAKVEIALSTGKEYEQDRRLF